MANFISREMRRREAEAAARKTRRGHWLRTIAMLLFIIAIIAWLFAR